MTEEMKSYKVAVVVTAIASVIAYIDAKSPEDAVEIAKTSLKKEDYEVEHVGDIQYTEVMETD